MSYPNGWTVSKKVTSLLLGVFPASIGGKSITGNRVPSPYTANPGTVIQSDHYDTCKAVTQALLLAL